MSISGTGVLYTPTANYCSNTTAVAFTYQALDSHGPSSAPATVTIHVPCINHAPTVPNVSHTFSGNTLTQTGFVTTFDITGNDVDHDPLSFTFATLPTLGTATVTATGLVTYISNPGAS